MTDITELAQSLKAAAEKWSVADEKYDRAEINVAEFVSAADQYNSIVRDRANILALVEALEKSESRLHEVAVVCATAEQALEAEKRICATWRKTAKSTGEKLEKAQGMETYWKTQCRGITCHCEELQARIAELEREQEHLRPVGVMSEQAFHRLENRECRFIALWPRPGIFLQRKRPEDGVIVYARTAAAAGIKVEAE
ncbi:TPA: ead/Ea22-like family protein [Klebsiella pneumoniae]|nr:ead/Ea22-like family protein [Klebsiella pneumoniae]